MASTNNALEFGRNVQSSWKKGLARFESKGKMFKVIMDKESYKFPESMLPEFPKVVDPETEYFVEFRVDDDGGIEEFINIRPAKWMGLKMKVVDVTRDRETGEPAPYTYTANFNGKDVDVTSFYIFYECVDPEDEFFGVRFPNKYNYKFEQDPDNPGFTRWKGDYDNPKATTLHRVVDHLTMLGAVSEAIEWPGDENILPELLGRMLAAAVVVETSGGGKYGSISEMMIKAPIKAVESIEKVDTELPGFVDEAVDEDEDNW